MAGIAPGSYTATDLKGMGFDPVNQSSPQTIGGMSYQLSDNHQGGANVSLAGPSSTPVDLGPSAASEATALNGGVNSAYQTYANAAQNLPKPLDIYNNLEASHGIPQLRNTATNLQGQVNDLTDTINRVEPNVTNTTANSLVTEGQRQGMITAQQHQLQIPLVPLSNNLRTIQQSIDTQESGINNAVNWAEQGNQDLLKVYGEGVTVAADNAARTMTGFTTDKEANLQTLLEKMREGNALTIAEMQQASELSNQSNQFNIAKLNAASQLSVAQTDIKRPISVAPFGSVYDPSTQKPASAVTPLGGSPYSSNSVNNRPSLDSFYTP